MRVTLFILTLFLSTYSIGQSLNVLFLGNSYTYANDLPGMVSGLATSNDDTLFYDSNLEGGSTFYSHSINTASRNKIKAGPWDYVVLQGQSLEMFGDFSGIPNPVPAAGVLDSLIHQSSPCSETVFYMTWGRKNGIGSYSYETMDSMIHLNYMNLAASLGAVVSPVGEVFKYIRQHFPEYELYEADESHPSPAGTYAAAACFYSTLFRKDPVPCSFNSIFPSEIALNIRIAARNVVYNHLSDWHIGEHDAFIRQCKDTATQASANGPWSLYPNPASVSLTLDFDNGHPAPMQLYNGMGILIREFEPVAGKEKIDVSGLPEGMYILNRKGESSGKIFIKQ